MKLLHVFAILFLFATIFVGDAFCPDRILNEPQEEINRPSPKILGLCKCNADCQKGQRCFHRIGQEWGECH